MQKSAFVVATMIALTVACGGEDARPGAAPTTPAATSTRSPLPAANDQRTIDVSTRGSTVDVTIEADGLAFKPTFVKVAAGQTLRLTLSNPGNTLHTFTITSPAINEQLRTASAPTTITVTAPAGGDLPFFCRLHAHVGMWGGFFSGSAPSSTPTPF